MPGLSAVIPIKQLADAKQRLASVLSPHQRSALMAAMAADTIEAVVAALGPEGVIVVAADAAGRDLARSFGVTIIDDASRSGQSAAAAQAVPYAIRRGLEAVIALPADIPLATPSEIARVAHSVLADSLNTSMGTLTIVPARDRDGSNALALTPPDALNFQFGPGSYQRHVAAALARGLRIHEFEFPGIALDIDTPDDLVELTRRPGRGRTHSYLARLGIDWRLGIDTSSPMTTQ